MNSPVHAIIWLAAIAVYFTPAIIAWTRHSSHKWRVTIVNLFAFLIVPWIVALVMACRSQRALADHA